MTNGNDDFQIQLLGLAGDIIQLVLPSGRSVALLKSNSASAAMVTFSPKRSSLGCSRRSRCSSRLRLANVLGIRSLSQAQPFLSWAAAARGPVAGAPALTKCVLPNVTVVVECVHAGCLCLRKRGTEAEGNGQGGHQTVFAVFFILEILIN